MRHGRHVPRLGSGRAAGHPLPQATRAGPPLRSVAYPGRYGPALTANLGTGPNDGWPLLPISMFGREPTSGPFSPNGLGSSATLVTDLPTMTPQSETVDLQLRDMARRIVPRTVLLLWHHLRMSARRCLRPFLRPLYLDLSYRVTGRRISRAQWVESARRETYQEMMEWTWSETQNNAPQYFERLRFAVENASGRVLELGCGIGTMTKWLASSKRVAEIVAVDAFEQAIAQLKSYQIPKVIPVTASSQDFGLPYDMHFDTVIACELLEHLYWDEEKEFLRHLRRYIHSDTRFVISVPIGWLEDPIHVRAFSKRKFIRHLGRYYGKPICVDYSSGYSQVAWGYFTRGWKTGRGASPGWGRLGR